MTARTTIRLDPGVAGVAVRFGGAITLRASPRHGCCGGRASLPVAEAGAPDDAAGWQTRDVDGITLYLDPALAAHSGDLTVRAEGFWRWQRLFVEGDMLATDHDAYH